MFLGRVVLHHIHKKWKDSLEGSLVRLSFVTELEFSKILYPGYFRIYQMESLKVLEH